eukprot:scaffold67205_cov66-Phaeocystis_antarctica.AAC.1
MRTSRLSEAERSTRCARLSVRGAVWWRKSNSDGTRGKEESREPKTSGCWPGSTDLCPSAMDAPSTGCCRGFFSSSMAEAMMVDQRCSSSGDLARSVVKAKATARAKARSVCCAPPQPAGLDSEDQVLIGAAGHHCAHRTDRDRALVLPEEVAARLHLAPLHVLRRALPHLLRPAGSPEATCSTCLGLPGASASLGGSASSRLVRARTQAIPAFVSTALPHVEVEPLAREYKVALVPHARLAERERGEQVVTQLQPPGQWEMVGWLLRRLARAPEAEAGRQVSRICQARPEVAQEPRWGTAKGPL